MSLSRRLAAGLLGLAGTLLAFLLLAAPASAHAVVVSSNPPDGTRLSSSPASVTIRFDEPVGIDVGYLRVVDSSGHRVDSGNAVHPNDDGAAIEVGLRSGLGDGSYLVSYRVISADSHPVAGSIRYVVGNGPLAPPTGAGSSTPVNEPVSVALAVSHWLSFAGVAVVGGSWLIFTVWPAGRHRLAVRRLVWTGWTVAVAGAAGEFLAQGPYAAGTGLGTVFRHDLMDATLHINAGQLLSVRLVLLGVLGFVLTALFGRRDRLNWVPELAMVVGVGIVVTYAASGHSESVHPRWLAVLVVALHLTAMIVWLGGLAVLVTAAVSRRRVAWADDWAEYDFDEAGYGEPAGTSPAAGMPPATEPIAPVAMVAVALAERPGRDPDGGAPDGGAPDDGGPDDGGPDDGGDPSGPDEFPDDPDDAADADDADDAAELAAGLPVFSRVALLCVGTLAVTGILQAWKEIGSVEAITATRYGLLVTVKVLLFCVLIGLGYLARKVLRTSTGLTALARLRRGLQVEVLVGAAVLAATAVLISQPPGSVALAAQHAKPRQATVAVTAQAKAVVEIDPDVHGSVQVSISLTGGVKPTSVTATASLPAKQLGPFPLQLQPAGAGSYTASGVLLPSAGDWQIQITVQTSEFDSTTAVATVKVY